MRFSTRSAARLFLAAASAATLAACGSAPKPEPMPTTAPNNSPPQQAPVQPLPPPQPPVTRYDPPPAPLPPTNQILPGSVQEFVINVGERVYFDFDSYAIRGDARGTLDAQANWLLRYPNVSVRIEGNADERGTREYNFALGARRANAIRDYLVSRGVSAGRIETVSYGKERPIDGASNESAWALNRNGRTAITGGAR